MESIPHELHDAEVMASLAETSDHGWEHLWAIVDAVSESADHGRLEGGTSNGPGEPLQMPYVDYSADVISLIEAIYAAHLIVPFDWMHWDGQVRYSMAASLDAAPVTEAIRVITATVRAERFNDVDLLESLKSGVLLASLAKVRRWVTHERT